MAKSNKISLAEWDLTAYNAIEKNAALIRRLYESIVKDAVRAFGIIKNPKQPFRFSDYPQIRDRVNKLFQEFANGLTITINKSSAELWDIANSKNDFIVGEFGDKVRMQKDILSRYAKPASAAALKSFQRRREAGLTLSDRVWKVAEQARYEVEQAIDGGIQQGFSAEQISRGIRMHLNEPERLFRRVRDASGNLVLSKSAKEYHPGRGVYRSSYKNAMRVGRTEPNMAYREADFIRWTQMDFVVGIEIRLSNNPNHCPMCVALAGKYPKDFKWRGWHAQCRCNQVPILISDNEYDLLELKLLNGDNSGVNSVNAIKTLPPGMKDWKNKKQDQISRMDNKPFFLTDNPAYFP